MKRLLAILLFFVCASVPALAASGVKGRVAWRGELVPGVKVRAYRSIADIPKGQEVAASAPAAQDGTYTLELPPGSYYLTARDFDGPPEPGRHFCYYSGGPVRVAEGSFTNVGFNLIRIPREAPPVAGAASGIQGEITFQDAPLERAYLYVYKEPGEGFKGPGYLIQPVEKGKFRLRLPPGEYWLLARKRAKGGQFGPIEIGDHFNYYHGNPVRVEPGMMREARIETITRLSMLEEGEAAAFSGIRGRILGPGGKPAAGVRVFAYRQAAMTGTPDFFSAPAGGDGVFELPLPKSGTWYLLARESFGGPAAPGELYGRYGGEPGRGVTLGPGETLREVTIHVERKKNP
jgi:hypothetical protein